MIVHFIPNLECMNMSIQAIGMDMTDAIKSYAKEKIESLKKFHDGIESSDVVVGMETHHHNQGKIYYAQVRLHFGGKEVLVRKDAEDLYKAIDKVRDHLKVEIEKVIGKFEERDKQELRDLKGYKDEE